jgi:Xaa-Pro aminopeptidase
MLNHTEFLAAAKSRRAELLNRLVEHPVSKAASGPPVAVIFSAPTAIRNHDVEHPYRADSDLAYLTGFTEPQAACVLAPEHPEGPFIFFVQEKDREKEIWTGMRAGVEGARDVYGADTAYVIGDLDKKLPHLLKNAGSVWSPLGWRPADDARLLRAARRARHLCRRGGSWPLVVGDLGDPLHEMRLIKDAFAIESLRRAAEITCEGHLQAMRGCRPGLLESDIEAMLTYAYRRGGAKRHGYDPIVAGGKNACILHYVENDQPLAADALLLIDSGAEVNHMTADLTRTFPVGGQFSAAQRDLYEVVLAANMHAIDLVRPGCNQEAVDDEARRILAQGLLDLGLMKGSVDEIVERRIPDDTPEDERATARRRSPLDRFYMHGTGHWLGSDVHDVGRYYLGDDPIPYRPGMVLTIEPGLYVSPDDTEAPEEMRGIGIRIEDDVLVTDGDPEVLTAASPKSVADLEDCVGSGHSRA